MDIKGSSTCFICGCRISWMAHIKTSRSGAYFIGNEVQAEAIATGSVLTEEGKKVEYDIIAACPRCGNKNKFKIAGDSPF